MSGFQMVFTILGIIIIVMSIKGVILTIMKGESFLCLIICGWCTILGIATILFSIPTDNYTAWEQKSESGVILQLENGKYVEDNGQECLYKVSTYTEAGEKIEEDKSIVRDENTFVEFVEIDEDAKASYSVFTRKNKSLLGIPNDTTQTKYVFYLPEE